MAKQQTNIFQKAVERYTAPTPVRYRAWGKFILIIGTIMQVALQEVEVNKYWTIGITLITAIGTALPELAVLHEKPTTDE